MSDRDGYCEHGTYVGGCGIDWLCFYCEMGYTWPEYKAEMRHRRIQRLRSHIPCGSIEKFDALMADLQQIGYHARTAQVMVDWVLNDHDLIERALAQLAELDPPDPATALTYDEVEAAGLDGTLRT